MAVYLADLALTDRPARMRRKLAAIAVAHRDAGLESPTEHGMVKRTLARIRRAKGSAPRQKSAPLVDDLRRMVAPLGAAPLDRRDRALILRGFAAARRFEPVDRTLPDWHSWRSADGKTYLRRGPGSFLYVPPNVPHAFGNPRTKRR